MGGLWATVPRLSGAALFFALASLGLPGLGDFIGEFLVLVGTYQVNVAMAAVAAIGVLAATFYALRFVQRAFQGPNSHAWQLPDLAVREGVTARRNDGFTALAGPLPATRVPLVCTSCKPISRDLEMSRDCQ